VEVANTDRRTSLRLDAELKVLERFEGLPWEARGCAELTGLALTPEARDCDVRKAAEKAKTRSASQSPDTMDAMAGTRYSDVSGQLVTAWAMRDPEDQTLWLADDRDNRAKLPNVGAQVALGDLDRDGYVEVLVSENTLDPKADALLVYTWQPEGLVSRYRLPVPSGVSAIAVCPPEDLGLSPIAIASDKSLWVVR
jgi:hypothetical protein